MPRTSVPDDGSVMHMPPTVRPAQASGSQRARCSSLPFWFRLLAKSMACARYARQNPGSDAASSSCAMTAATASMPEPPKRSRTVMPSSPSVPRRRNSGRLDVSVRSASAACGSTSRWVNSRTIWRSAPCSAVGLNRSAMAGVLYVRDAHVRGWRPKAPPVGWSAHGWSGYSLAMRPRVLVVLLLLARVPLAGPCPELPVLPDAPNPFDLQYGATNVN